MSGAKDPAIKLFGKTIALPPIAAVDASTAVRCTAIDCSEVATGAAVEDDRDQDRTSSRSESPDEALVKFEVDRDADESKSENKENKVKREDQTSPQASGNSVHYHGSSADDNTEAETEEKSDENAPQEKTLKRPDKLLPCPRCNSMETKFCYFNNYNVNQPRHFCRSCQRYWTAGGSMRNVPVGAGRRKNKIVSQCGQVNAAETLQAERVDLPAAMIANGSILAFGCDKPLSEPMASVSIAHKNMENSMMSRLQKPEENQEPISEDGPSKSSLEEPTVQNCAVFPQQMPYYPGSPWAYPPWHAAVPLPPFFPNGCLMPFYPAATFWGWNMPLQSPSGGTNVSSCQASPTVGKRSRDGNAVSSGSSEEDLRVETKDSDRSLWFPKTLRINDPEEAAKSSIWTTLGIMNDKTCSLGGGAIFNGLQANNHEENHSAIPSAVLQANPAAFLRSQSLRESW